VYFGVMLSLAGLIRVSSEQRSDWRTILLLAIGPVILLYSHFGTAVWIAILGIVAIAAVNGRPKQYRTFFAGALLAACLAAPLALWWIQKTSRLGRSPLLAPSQWWAVIALPFSQSITRAWISVPARWDSEAIAP